MSIARFANIFRQSSVPKDVDFEQTLALGDRDVDVALAPVAACSPCAPTQIPQGETFAGLKTIPYRYTVQSRAFTTAAGEEAHIAGEFDIHNIPIFQFLAFIDGDLFIMPLPDMTLHGRLHTNSNLYVQPDNTLRIEDLPPVIPNVQVSAGGAIYRGGRKYDDSWRCWGDTYIDKIEDAVAPLNDLDPQIMSCADEAPLSDATLATWKGSVRAGVDSIITPDVGITARGSGDYWKHADLRVVLRLDQPRSSIDFSAPDLCPTGAGTLQSPALYPIEVQTAAGAQDPTATRALWRFLCERRGALFYTDVPNAPPSPPGNDWQYAVGRSNYTPPFTSSGGAAVLGPSIGSAGALGDNLRVYRRAGDDTNGDGALSLGDRNDATCPLGSGAAPWWRPPSCPWPNLLPSSDSWFLDTDYRRGAFWNHREQQWMYLLNLNLRALIEWNEMNGDPLFPHDDDSDGGLVLFLTVQGPQSLARQNNYGVRVFDSADLDMRNTTFPTGLSDPTGVSVVSDQAILVEGNYNIADKSPAAVMGDAVWILSHGWETPIGGAPNDLKSVFDLSTGYRDVPVSDFPGGLGGAGSFSGSASLGINAAFLFGLGESTRDPDWYNGGLENFPRFLESWTGRTFNYRGSFVSLGKPQHKRNDWTCGSGNACNGSGVYDPPQREYDFDPDFNRVELLPPMTPKFVYIQQRLYTRIFN